MSLLARRLPLSTSMVELERHQCPKLGEDGGVKGRSPLAGARSAALEAGVLAQQHRDAARRTGARLPPQTGSATTEARGTRPLVVRPGASRLFGGRWRAGSNRRRFGAYAACCARTCARTSVSRLFSTIVPGSTVLILSNVRKGRSVPLNRTANRPS